MEVKEGHVDEMRKEEKGKGGMIKGIASYHLMIAESLNPGQKNGVWSLKFE